MVRRGGEAREEEGEAKRREEQGRPQVTLRMGVKGGPCLCEHGADLERAVWPRGSMAWSDQHGQAPAAGPCPARPEGK